MNGEPSILATTDVVKRFHQGRRVITAVDHVDVTVRPGRSVGIAGESGSGKSTLMRLLLALERPTAGGVLFDGQPLDELSRSEFRRYRSEVQAVFQDPGSAFNPRKAIWHSVTEPAWSLHGLSRGEQKKLAAELLERVDLDPRYADRLPHQLSGGERQRVAIARAMSSNPRLLVLDEPVTALDLSIRGHVLNLLVEQARSAAVTYVIVSHDLTAIYHLADHLYVMYAGQMVEEGPTTELVADPLHPYTQLLVASVGDPLYKPEVDSDSPPPIGACPLINRCAHAMPQCSAMPAMTSVGSERRVACHLYGEEVEEGNRSMPGLVEAHTPSQA